MEQRTVDNVETAAGVLEITRVGSEALDCILLLMQEASDWLLSRGIRQWRRMFDDEGRAFVAARIDTDEMYLVFKDGEPVATFSFRWQETTMWGDAGTDDQAGYLHGLAVSRKVGGQGVGMALMAWVSQRVTMRGRHFLRLNTAANNPGINAYYEQAGFRPCGVVPHGLGGMTLLFERELRNRKDAQ